MEDAFNLGILGRESKFLHFLGEPPTKISLELPRNFSNPPKGTSPSPHFPSQTSLLSIQQQQQQQPFSFYRLLSSGFCFVRTNSRTIGAMAEDGAVTVYNSSAITDATKNPFSLKAGLTQILRGGAIVEVTNAEQAKIAEEAGACCLLVSEPLHRGISRMPDPSLIKEIKRTVSIPIMTRARVGHFVEAQILEAIGVDYIDESEALALADEENFINKHNFRCPFVCGCQNLGEALRRVREGAAMIRTQGDLSGSGNIAKTVKNVRAVMGEMRILNNMDEDEVFAFSKKIAAPYDLVAQTKQMGRLPVVQFAAGGIVSPADTALLMQLGCDGVFVGSEIFECSDPYKRVRGIIQAVRHYTDPHVLVETSSGLEDTMAGLNLGEDRIEQFAHGDV
ncbi:pyridoxal 5'-phosphate synthase-like subunit PDX1.2 [Alnus glutinosa]|uniref:pyridoxal 5'-phosphate synthase-like subunit PDX1.2 n=1 Tax=Alnus glutinosa TaxID=3517 RepID=UPI002D7A1A75|nr:pyridoxal 5'-phosphate synthase-like subunit PDX1.2 [Alnus glutinosa]